MNLKPNSLLQGGKYRIEKVLGQGGFGITYQAVQVALNRKVAIKEFFVKDFCNRDEATAHVTLGTQSKRELVEKLRSKFIDEAFMVEKMHHKSIVSVYDVFEENDTAYYVMDYVDGQSLGEMISQRGSLPVQKALKYVCQIAEALQAIHDRNCLHLDVKPGNIMVHNGDDNAILIDFGASKQYDEVNGENTSTLIGQTPGYAPPEQMGQNVTQFLPATDIYALGATFYKLLTGKTPPTASQRIAGDEMDELPTTVDATIRKAIDAAMILNKKKRLQTIAEFLTILGKNEEDDAEVTVLDVVPQKKRSSSQRKQRTESELGASQKTRRTSARSLESITDRQISGHEYVDLGLSVMWATCNVGAVKPEDYGDYFAWGETSPKSDYDCIHYNYNKGEKLALGRTSSEDAARANWGGNWRIPTNIECQELVDKCKWIWATQGGHSGCKIVGPNGNSIFLPAAGFCYSKNFNYCDSRGLYWSATAIGGYKNRAYHIGFGCGYNYCDDYGCDNGLTIRPVSEVKDRKSVSGEQKNEEAEKTVIQSGNSVKRPKATSVKKTSSRKVESVPKSVSRPNPVSVGNKDVYKKRTDSKCNETGGADDNIFERDDLFNRIIWAVIKLAAILAFMNLCGFIGCEEENYWGSIDMIIVNVLAAVAWIYMLIKGSDE